MDKTRIKQLMDAAGYPQSQTIQQLIYQVMNEVEQELIARYEDPVDIREIIQCLTDSNALLEDTQQAHKILPDKHAGNRKMVCDAARAAYGMGGVPYDPV